MSGSSDISAKRRALLQRRLQGSNRTRDQKAETPPSSWPATPMQRQLWTFQQRYPKEAAYHIHTTVELSGEFNLEHLNQALSRVISKHTALGTVFDFSDDRLCQYYQPLAAPTLTAMPIREERLKPELVNFINEPFDLSKGPLYRIGLWEVAPDRHVFSMALHHIIADEQSLEIFWKDLSAYWEDDRAGGIACCSEYAARYDKNGRLGDESYWLEQLDKVKPLDLPLDFARGGSQSFNGTYLSRPLEDGLVGNLEQLARQQQTTLTSLAFAVFALLLSRQTQQRDIVIGMPMANRSTATEQKTMGLFINSLPLRIQVDDEHTILEYLKQCRDVVVGGLQHQRVALDNLLRGHGSSLGGDRNPLFRTMMVTLTQPSYSLPGLSVKPVSLDTGRSKFDLTLFLDTDSNSVALEFNRDLFLHQTAEFLLSEYCRLLGRFVKNQNEPLSTFLFPSQVETSEIKKLHVSQGRGKKEEMVPTLIRRMAGQNPDALAVVDESGSMSFGELQTKAEALAGELQKRGLEPGQMVVVSLTAGIEFVVAVHATHLAGGGYVPLDPEYPENHQQRVLTQLAEGVDTLLAISDSEAAFSKNQDIELVNIKNSFPQEQFKSISFLPSLPAYVIYTSGSTGEPKGVVISHEALAASNNARCQYYGTPKSFLLLSSFAFDSSVAGLFWSLSTGGSLVVASPTQRKDPSEIARLIEANRVSHTLLLPSLWALVAKTAPSKQLVSLDCVIVAGEACPTSLVAQHWNTLPRVRLVNEYGPTECCVWATVYPCQKTDVHGSVPIGKPLAHIEAEVRDAQGRLLPLGAIGELYLGGRALSLGYFGNRALTEKSFISGTSDSRRPTYYRTGDLVRWRSDGQLVFYGRGDGQVKLRGHRIELAHIESLLKDISSVSDAAVTILEDGPKKILVGFLQDTSDLCNPSEVIQSLAQDLPAYMVPTRVVTVDQIPRLANGKLDHKALKSLYLSDQPVSIDSFAKSADALQVAIGQIWARILGVNVVRPTDDFFELGGDSLLGVQMIMDVGKQFNLNIQLSALFEAPALFQFAHRVRDAGPSLTSIAPIRRSGNQPPVFCVHGRTQFLTQTLPEDWPVYLVFGDVMRQKQMLSSVESVASHYLNELLSVQGQGPYYILGFSAGGMIAYEMARQLKQRGLQVGLVALADPPPFLAMSHWRFRIYRKLFHLRQKGGFISQAMALGRVLPGIFQRALVRRYKRLMNRVTSISAKPMTVNQIEFAFLQHYVEIGKKYQYEGIDVPCAVFLPESHPELIAGMKREWEKLNPGKTQVEVIGGAQRHLDLITETSGAALAESFREALERVNRGG